MTSEDLDELLAGIAPVIRSYVSSTCADLQKQVAALDAKAAIPGPGVSSLLISADGRLVTHLTDGRTLDVGPMPVKDGAPGLDVDPARLQALELEIASLRSELAVKQADIDGLRASVLTLDDVQVLIDGGREKWIAGLPTPKDGQDGKSVSLEDVGPLIAAEVQKVAAAIPVPKDGVDGRDGQDGKAVTVEDLAPLIVAEVRASVAGLPVPKDGVDGRSLEVSDVIPLVAVEVQKAIAAVPAPKDGQPGKDGQSVSLDDVLDDVLPLISSAVEKFVAALPVPKDGAPGTSVTVEDVAPLIVSEVQKLVSTIPVPRDGVDGRSVEPGEVELLVAAEVERAVAAIPAPKDGEPGTPGEAGASITAADVAPLIAAEVQKTVALIPAAKDGEPGPPGADGKTVTADDVAPLIAAEVLKAVASIPPAKDGAPGRSVDPIDLFGMVSAHVAKAVAAVPAPKDGEPGADGKSLAPDDVAPLIAAEVAKAVAAIAVPKDGKDGVGLSGALIDREGRLALTLSDGTVKHLGTVMGRDGRDVDMADVASLISKELSTWPRPKDGQDGLGFDEFSVVPDGERGFTFNFARGEQVKSFSFTIPSVIYRDLWTDGKSYEKGDAVTFGGCMWVAKEATTAKPDFTPAAAKYWRLAIKEGRRGKDADPAVIEALVEKAVAKLPKPKAQEPHR